MKQGRAHFPSPMLSIRWLALACGLALGTAHANDQRDIAQLLRDGKLAEAQARVERQLAAQPRDPQMRLFKGVIQRESGRSYEAITTFTRLSEDHPELPEPYNNLAVVYAAQGQYDKARVALEKALRTNPSYATAHENLADIYARLASQAYSKALQLDGLTPQPGPTRLALIQELFRVPGSAPGTVLAAAPSAPPSRPAAVPPAPTRPALVVAAAPAPTPAAVVIPAAPAPAAASTPAVSAQGSRDVELAVRAWARAWSEKNMTQYLAAYDKGFETPGQQSRGAWEQDRRLRISGKSRITVELLDLQITVKDQRAVAKFRQDYKADALTVLSRKTLELAKTGERWLIVKESSGG